MTLGTQREKLDPMALQVPALTASRRPRSRHLLKIVLVLASVVFSLLLAEGILRIVFSSDDLMLDAIEDTNWTSAAAPEKGIYTADADLGYRPVLGTKRYNEFGTHLNSYDVNENAGKTRLLFIGDSVTERRRIVDGLREAYGEERYEYWNAGVGGFNTPQEVKWYLRWNHKIRPDHVILTFHNNDFLVTPVAFHDDQDRLRVFAPQTRGEGIQPWHPWLYKNSYLYRLYRKVLASSDNPCDQKANVDGVRENLARLRDNLAESGIEFTVVLLPILSPTKEWTEGQSWSRKASIQIFEDLGLRYFDLMDPLLAALADGVDIRETPEDAWHPNDEGGFRFAGYLAQKGLLRGLRPEGIHKSGLEADRDSVSISARSTQTLTCDAGPEHANLRYLLLGTASGIRLGTRIGRKILPLHLDGYFRYLATNPNTLIAGSSGRLDSQGRAVIEIAPPAGLESSVASLTLHHAFLVYRDNPFVCSFVSNAVPVTITK